MFSHVFASIRSIIVPFAACARICRYSQHVANIEKKRFSQIRIACPVPSRSRARLSSRHLFAPARKPRVTGEVAHAASSKPRVIDEVAPSSKPRLIEEAHVRIIGVSTTTECIKSNNQDLLKKRQVKTNGCSQDASIII